MTEALFEVIQNAHDGATLTHSQVEKYEAVVEAIKSNPDLLWPEGDKWMSNGVVDAYVAREYPRSPIAPALAYEIRDRAQVVIDAKDAKFEYHVKDWKAAEDLWIEHELYYKEEITRLRGELEEAKKLLTQEQADHKALGLNLRFVRSELDKAKERVRELEGNKSNIDLEKLRAKWEAVIENTTPEDFEKWLAERNK